MSDGPYGQSAQIYWEKNWLPFPVKGKHEAIPKGITGIEGKPPRWDQVQGWIKARPFSNVAVRANGWIAIDVDGPEGNETLRAATAELGELPDTWQCTSWTPDAERFQLFFKIPVGFSVRLAEGRFRKRFGEHVDIIHTGHRYSIVAPSKHPDTGNLYRWYGPDGEPSKVPVRTELPELPPPWLDYLAEGGPAEAAAGQAADTPDWYDEPEADHGWSETSARAEVERMLHRIRTVDNNVNTQAGGAMREVGRFVPALLTEDEAVRLCAEALGAEPDQGNPWHSDSWNAANGKAWTAQTLAVTSVARGMTEARSVAPVGAEPESQAEDERYTDAFMSARLVREALGGRFVYTAALGWLCHDGVRWVEVTDEVVHEAARKWTLAGYVKALADYRRAASSGADVKPMSEDPDLRGWAGLQGAGRIASVVKLTRGIEGIFHDASEFDQDPALLNTPSGVVDLRTGISRPHNPRDMITKVTGAPYVPGAESEAFKRALEAVPEDVPDWLQLMLGEATTGHSGERMVLLTGTGRNSKTTLMGSVYRALGGYAAKVPNTLLLRSKQAGAATPERMTLRGIRLAYMEETPEDGYLDANVAKDLLDAEVIDGRQLYRNTTSWTPTHSIFLNTNHPPTITATDDGTWRRMARVNFPYRFRKAEDPLELPTDRRGDPRIKAALAAPEGQAAILAWLVAGAVRYYAAGSVEEAGATPESVTAAVHKWRAESDDILRFIDECMEFNSEMWVAGTDLYREFTQWQSRNGQRVLSSKAFGARLDGHSVLGKRVGRTQRRKALPGLSRPGLLLNGVMHSLPERPKGWAGLCFIDDGDSLEYPEDA